METNTSIETEAVAKNIDEVLAEKCYKDLIRVDGDTRLHAGSGFFYALSASGNLLQNDSLEKLRANIFESERRRDSARKFVVPVCKVLVEVPGKGWKTATYKGFVRGRGHRFEFADGSTYDGGTSYTAPRICRDIGRREQLEHARVEFEHAKKQHEKLNNEHTTNYFKNSGNDAGECLEATKEFLRILRVEYDRSDEAKK